MHLNADLIIGMFIGFILSCCCGERRCSPAVNADRSILAKLLLGFVHLANKIDEALSRFGHTLLWPISELELTHCSWLAILRGERKMIRDIETLMIMWSDFFSLKRIFVLYWQRSETLPGNILFFPSNDYCYLTPNQWLWLTWSCNVSASAIVSHSVGNYIFSLLHSLSDSPLMEINRASVSVASVQDRLDWSHL